MTFGLIKELVIYDSSESLRKRGTKKREREGQKESER